MTSWKLLISSTNLIQTSYSTHSHWKSTARELTSELQKVSALCNTLQMAHHSLNPHLHDTVVTDFLAKEVKFSIKFRQQLTLPRRQRPKSEQRFVLLDNSALWIQGRIFLKQTFQINFWKLRPSPEWRRVNAPPQKFPSGCSKCWCFMFVCICKWLRVRKSENCIHGKSYCTLRSTSLSSYLISGLYSVHQDPEILHVSFP